MEAKKNNLLSKNIIAHENKPEHIWKYQVCEPNEAVPVILYKNIQIVPINSKGKKWKQATKPGIPSITCQSHMHFCWVIQHNLQK